MSMWERLIGPFEWVDLARGVSNRRKIDDDTEMLKEVIQAKDAEMKIWIANDGFVEVENVG